MNFSRRFKFNIGSSWVGLFIQLAITMLLTPLVLRELGGGRYGVWALITTITGYYGLLDAGARVTIGRNITRYWALRDWQRMNRLASAGLATLLACAAIVLLATVLCAILATSAFRLPAELAGEFRWCLLAVGTSVAIQFCFFVHSAALGAVQRYDLANVSHIVSQLVYACGVPLLLLAGGGLIELSLWLSMTNVLSYAMRWRFARRVLPQLHMSLHLVDRGGLAEFARFGIWQLLVNLARQVIACSDAIVIAVTMSTTSVAPFYLASRVAAYLTRVFVPVGDVLFPAIVHFDAVGSGDRIRRLYLRGSRLLWLLSLGLGFLAAMWSREFFALWVGERQAGFDGRLSDLFAILLVAAVVTAPQQISLPAFLALGRQHVLALLLVAEAAANVALSLLLVRTYGLIGIAWGTCLPALLFQGILHPALTCRMLGIRISTYGKEVLLRPLVCGLILAVVAWLRPDVGVNGWLMLLAVGGCTGVLIAAVAVTVGLDRADSEQSLLPTLRRVKRLVTIGRSIRGARAPEPTASTAAGHD